MDPELKKLLEQRATLVTQAQAKLDEITDKTDEARATEINREFDAMISEANGLEEKIQRRQNLAEAARRVAAVDPRRPQGGEGRSEAAAAAGDGQMTYREAFHAYLQAGGVRSEMAPEARAALQRGYAPIAPGEQRSTIQVAGTDASGGYLVPQEMMQMLVASMAAWGPMYDDNLCRVINTAGGGTIPIPGVDDTANEAAATATEGATLGDGTAIVFSKAQLDDYMYDTGWITISVQLATGAMQDVEAIVSELLGERLGRKSNRVLTVGSGVGEPLGIVSGASAGKTTAANNAITPDELMDLYHSLDPAYRASPKAMAQMNDNTLGVIHKLKDNYGRYLVQTAPDGSGVIRLGAVQFKYAINQAMADIGSATTPLIFGDHSRYYVRKIGRPIVGALQDKDFWPGYGMAGYVRLDGATSDAKAIRKLTMAV